MRARLLSSLASKLGLAASQAVFLPMVADKFAEIGGLRFEQIVALGMRDREVASELVASCDKAASTDAGLEILAGLAKAQA